MKDKTDIVKADFVESLPSVDDLKNRARWRMPRFAFEYLDGGCNEDVNIRKNTDEIREVELMPNYLEAHSGSSLRTELFGEMYDAPFGIAPIGLQGLMWPGASEILAKTSVRYNIPFVLSTVTTCSIERAAEITDGRFWFQLYHPAEIEMRDDLLYRAETAGCKVLVVLSDVPTFGFRPRDIRNGLAMPPRMTLRNIFQMIGRPNWTWQTWMMGKPEFKSLSKYMPTDLDMAQLGKFMNKTFEGRLTKDRLQSIRDIWQGKLVVKGIVNEQDAESCAAVGVDGIIVSNHGGRQLDAGESTIKPLIRLAKQFNKKMTVMMDSGIRGGPDIARSLASGADFAFLGRAFMYSVGAIGQRGGNHAAAMLRMQLQQVLEQLGCDNINNLSNHLVQNQVTLK